MKERKKYILQIGVMLLFIILIVIWTVWDSNHSLREMLSESIHQTLNEVSEQQCFNLHQEMESDLGALKNIVFQLKELPLQDTTLYLETLVKNTGFSTLALVDADGIGTDCEGRRIELAGNDLFQRAMAGETVVGSGIEAIFQGDSVLPIAVPVSLHGDGMPGGVLIGGYTPQALDSLILPSFDGKGRTYLVGSGGWLAAPIENVFQIEGISPENVSDHMKVISGSGKTQMVSDMEQGKSGHMVFEINDVLWHCHYNAIGFGGWYIFTLVRHDIGAAYAAAISTRVAAMSGVIVVCFLVCALLIFQQQRRHTAALENLAYNDELCHCPNLPKFKLDVQQFMDLHGDEKTDVIKFDIRDFKLLNKMLGKEMGDTVLIRIAEALRQTVRPGMFCRAHDDEFYMFLVCGTSAKRNEIREAFFARFYELMGTGFTYQLNIVEGHYFMDFENCKNAAEAIEKVNIAHSKARKMGVPLCVYDRELVEKALWEKEVENTLESALEKEEFKVYLQAQYNLLDETVSSAEALVRWEKEGVTVPPGEFIPVLEQRGTIERLDFYMFEHVCIILQKWMQDGVRPIEIAVNFSRKHLADPDFVQKLCVTADRYRIPHRSLVIELTETDIWENEEVLLGMTEQLHKNGFLLAVDDFGTGYSSLSLLKNLPVDILKIDRSFFTDNRYKTRAKLLLSGVMEIAKQLGMVTVAEGVEEPKHIDFLRKTGCDKVQGYYYEKPLPADQFWAEKKRAPLPVLPVALPLSHSIGDVKKGRGELGEEMPVRIYRLFQFSLREAITQKYGDGEAMDIYRSGGWIAGRSFAREYIDLTQSEEGFIRELQNVLRREKIGDMRMEKKSGCEGQMVLTISNDLDCSGIEDEGAALCQYDEGFIAGILFEYTHQIYSVTEINCWASGSENCRFLIKAQDAKKGTYVLGGGENKCKKECIFCIRDSFHAPAQYKGQASQ